MPWIIGVDEAGYGPNLGPLVMTAVTCRVSETTQAVNLWQILEGAVCRRHALGDPRLFIDDSKLVYSSLRGLGALERGVLAALWRPAELEELTLEGFLNGVASADDAGLGRENWYTGLSKLPVSAAAHEIADAAICFRDCCGKAGVSLGPARSAIVVAGRFNALLDHWGSKGAILGHALTELIRYQHRQLDDGEDLWFVIDKHGGRNSYAGMLQQALPEGFVVTSRESAACSEYRVLGIERAIRLTILPRADSGHFCVALASMISKYLRELLMLEFNQFWQQKVPGIKPTAGYPGDAARFYASIKPTLAGLGIEEQSVWRRV